MRHAGAYAALRSGIDGQRNYHTVSICVGSVKRALADGVSHNQEGRKQHTATFGRPDREGVAELSIHGRSITHRCQS